MSPTQNQKGKSVLLTPGHMSGFPGLPSPLTKAPVPAAQSNHT